eukprot:TRINITY_DN4091_c0_g1_i1.p1 TRINITY_DN4091_c0_g1~~TRINITY_DN4091_c0_g1_i1.p1  ORF type:complete len:155 (-),score=8.36 TRINITY_DN4091_c0_g1_i1:99-563(-)
MRLMCCRLHHVDILFLNNLIILLIAHALFCVIAAGTSFWYNTGDKYSTAGTVGIGLFIWASAVIPALLLFFRSSGEIAHSVLLYIIIIVHLCFYLIFILLYCWVFQGRIINVSSSSSSLNRIKASLAFWSIDALITIGLIVVSVLTCGGENNNK